MSAHELKWQSTGVSGFLEVAAGGEVQFSFCRRGEQERR